MIISATESMPVDILSYLYKDFVQASNKKGAFAVF